MHTLLIIIAAAFITAVFTIIITSLYQLTAFGGMPQWLGIAVTGIVMFFLGHGAGKRAMKKKQSKG